jgi:ABC-type uncharacterized transport system auxiliary subunit
MRIAAMLMRKKSVRGEFMKRNVRTLVLSAGAAMCAVGMSIAAAGCGAARPVKYYQLTVPGDMSSTSDASAIPVTLLVGPLLGSRIYRDDRIVYSSGEQMGMYESERWASPPTEMFQEVLFRELRASGKYKTVNMLRSNARGDYILNGRLYDFKEVTGGTFAARIAVEYELRDTKTGATVWSHYYSHDEPVSGCVGDRSQCAGNRVARAGGRRGVLSGESASCGESGCQIWKLVGPYSFVSGRRKRSRNSAS